MANWWDSYPDAEPVTSAAPAAAVHPAQAPAATGQPPQQTNWWDVYPDAEPADAPQPTASASATEKPQVSGVGAVQNGFEDMLLLGGKDELFAGLDAAAQPVFGTGNEGESFSDRYNKNLTDQRAYLDASAEQHPVLNTVGGVAGAIAPALLSGGASLAGTGAKTLLGTSAKSAAVGAAQGGAYGFGSATGDIGDRVEEAGTGALIGGAIGGVAPATIGALSGVARKVVPTRLLPGQGAQRAIDGPETAAAAPADFSVNSEGAAQRATRDGFSPSSSGTAEPTLRDSAKAVVDAANATGKKSDVALGDLAAVVQPRQDVLDAAERLGMQNLTPAEISGNPAFRSLEGALSALPGNEIAPQRAANLADLSRRADDFITEFGGNTDKAAYSDAFKAKADDTLESLQKESNGLYDQVAQALPDTTPAPATSTIAYLTQKIESLGGDRSLLSSQERRTLGALSRVDDAGNPILPTYKALDQIRKEVGEGLRGQGRFASTERGTLSQLYGTLSDDQQRIAEQAGVGDVFSSAKALVAQRKQLEAGYQKILGKELSGSIANTLGASVKQLGKGDFKNFDTIIQRIPEEDRQAAIVTALNDAFTSGTAQRQISAAGFSKWWGDVSRHGAARERFAKYLPEEAIKRLDDIGIVAKAISDASRDAVRTGASKGVLDDYLAEGGLVSRIWGIAKPALVAEGLGSAAGIPGLGATIAVVAGMRKNAIPIQQRAGELLASDRFRDMLRSYAASGGQLKANVLVREKQLMRTQAYRGWEKALDASARARIATVGPLVYLTEPVQKPAPIELPATTVNP